MFCASFTSIAIHFPPLCFLVYWELHVGCFFCICSIEPAFAYFISLIEWMMLVCSSPNRWAQHTHIKTFRFFRFEAELLQINRTLIYGLQSFSFGKIETTNTDTYIRFNTFLSYTYVYIWFSHTRMYMIFWLKRKKDCFRWKVAWFWIKVEFNR